MNSTQKIKILLLLLSPISPTISLDNTPNNHTLYTPTTLLSPSPPPPPPMTPLKPSMAVIVAVLTTMFSVTFLLLLYAKHCKRGNNGNNELSDLYSSNTVPPKNSGVDRTIIESLPVFRFGALTGEKDGLECAVCLGRFEQTEVLRLLPKCKHAFHVECVDTWLEAHSTCPLCRYRVEPEDILLIGRDTTQRQSAGEAADSVCLPPPPVRRVSGRHSSAGERSDASLQIVVEPSERRSVDSYRKPRRERKDGVLLPEGTQRSDHRRLEHRILIGGSGMEQRWSDVQPSDLLYLRSEMIMSDSRRFSISGSRPLKQTCNSSSNNESGRSVINGRSVSEITGLSRFRKTTSHRQRQRQHGVLSRWLAWVPQKQSVVIDT